MRAIALRVWPGWRDAVAVLLLIAVTWHLVARDGGRSVSAAAPLLLLASITVIACWQQLATSSRTVKVLAAGWTLSPTVAFAFASIRAGATRPVLVASLAVPVWLATQRVWRQPWGPAALGAILALTALRSTYLTGLAWFGGGGASSQAWLALSWHNQAAALTGVFGLTGLAVAAVSRGWLRVTAVGIASVGLAGAWLSGSRGGVAALALAAAVMLILALRRSGRGAWRRVAPGVALGMLLAAGISAALTGGGGQPVAERDQSAVNNLEARFGHWEAAARAAATAPATGHGPGSYRWASAPVYPDDVNLTSSAHNEWLEVLADRGVVGAAPVWAAALGIGLLVLRSLRRRTEPWQHRGSGREAGEIAAVGVVVLLGVHSGIDFDWQYPVLLALLTIAAGALHAEAVATGGPSPERPPAEPPAAAKDVATAPVDPPPAPRADHVLTFTAGIGALVLLAGAAALAVPQLTGQPEPWRIEPRVAAALQASVAGDTDAAIEEIDAVNRWNPGEWSLPVVRAVIEYRAGKLDDAGLRQSLEGGASHREQLLVATELVDADAADLATKVLDDLDASLRRRTAWGVGDIGQAAAMLRLRMVADAGCEAVTDAWPRISSALADVGGDPAQLADRAEDELGCRLEATESV